MSENPFKKLSEEEKNISNDEKKSPEKKENFSKPINLEKIPDTKTQKTKRGILGFFVSFVVLALFLSVLLIFILIVGGPNNPLLDLLGIQAAQIQSSLLGLTQTVFSIFSVGLISIGTIFLFLGVSAKTNKKRFFVTSGIFGGLLFLTIIIWLGLYNYINSFNFGLNVKAEIEVSLQDGSKNLDSVVAPEILNFSILNGILNKERLGKKVESIYWDFNNDGNFDYKGIEAKMSHEFNTPGNKKVTAILNFKDGTNQSYEKMFRIKDGSFGVDYKSGTAPLKVTFNTENIVENSVNAISEFRWYFDGGENPDLVTAKSIVEHTFKKVGKYNVVLVAVDIKNNIKKFTKIIEVLDAGSSSNLISNISVFPGTKGEAPFKVKFSGENSVSKKGKIISYSWDFGDLEKPTSGVDFVKTFEKPGTYNIKLTVQNEYGEKNFSTKTILVTGKEEKPVAKILTNLKENTFTVPFKLELDGSKSTDLNNDIVKYSWDLDGNGISDSFGEKIEKEIRKSGEYKIILTVEDSKGNISEDSIKIIGKDSVKAMISTDRDSGTAPLVVLFDASFSRVDAGDTIANYSWDFGDGEISEFSSAQKRHKFEDPGIYDVKLKIFTNNGKTFKSDKKIFVREESVQACFGISKNQTNVDSKIQFSSQCSSGEIKSWHWDFGDGKISYERNPVHSFKKTGKYTVILQITDYKNNVSEFRKGVEIK